MYKYEYMQAVKVQAVITGGVIDENGRSLRMIGRMHVKAGDTVWTDGRIVYGHSPAKEKGMPAFQRSGIPSIGDGTVWSGDWGNCIFKAGGTLYAPRTDLNMGLRMNHVVNYMYTTSKAVYGHDDTSPRTNFLGDYLDVKVADNTVYTAEYTLDDAPFYGKTSQSEDYAFYRDLQTFIANFYFYHDDEASSPANPVFDLRYHSTGGKVYSNPVIAIKQNGSTIGTITLSDYQFALDTLKEIYLSYDESGDSRIEKRYHFTGNVDGKKVPGCDIWCSYMFTQVLNFTFTDNAGNWEMILLSAVEGVVLPHTIDTEYNFVTEEYEDVYSDYHISCPVIYYVMRIKSNGTPEMLHRRIIVKSFEDNAVTRLAWENAKAVEVEEIDVKQEPYFEIDFGDCSMTTNLKSIGSITDSNGNSVVGGIALYGFEQFTMSNPEMAQPIGAINSFVTVNLKTGQSSISQSSNQHIGYWTGNSLGKREGLYSPPIIVLSKYAPAYFGRLSLYQFPDKNYLISLRQQGLYKTNDAGFTPIVFYPLNINLDLVKNLRNLRVIKTMDDLIADVTSNN